MNILLVLPKIFINLAEPEHFPVGMAYVSSSLKQAGHNVTILNLNFEERPTKELLKEYINKFHIQIVETGGLVTHYYMIKEIVDIVKEIDECIYTLIGGGIVTGDPEVAMQAIKNADFGVFGEGEITNNEVSRAINGEIKFSEVNGLIYRARFDTNCKTSEDCIKNPPREEIKDLDSLPWPDYEGFNLDKMLEYAPKKYVTISTGRSCKYHCTFCFHTSGQTYRQRSLDSFFQELDYLVKKYGIDNIYITDELFASDKDRLNEFCKRIKKYNILWAIQLRVNIVTKELLQQLKDSGCIIISFGLESADNNVLKSMRKGITLEMIDNALKYSYEVGISAHGSFIFGDINEDKTSVERTLEWWNNHREYNIGLALIQVYPGTFLYKYACENGIINDKVQFIENCCPYINVSKLTDKEYIDLAIRLERELSKPLLELEYNVEIHEVKKNIIDIYTKCLKCGQNLIFNEISKSKITTVKCKFCDEKYTINPYRLYKNNVSNNLSLLEENNLSIAFWIGWNDDILTAVYNSNSKLQNMNYILISPINVKWNQEFLGHIINKDTILDNGMIDTVIICDYTFNDYVKNTIKTQYKKVKNIISVGTLINNTLNI